MLSNFDLDKWLRYGFSGGMFITTVILTTVRCDKENSCTNIYIFSDFLCKNPTLLIGFSFLIGALIYTIHRASIYRMFYGYSLYRLGKFKCVCSVFTIWEDPSGMLERDLARWRIDEKEKPEFKKLTEWASQIHFLYCITWSILLGLLSASIFFELKYNIYFIILSFITFGLGIATHKRYLQYEEKLLDELDASNFVSYYY